MRVDLLKILRNPTLEIFQTTPPKTKDELLKFVHNLNPLKSTTKGEKSLKGLFLTLKHYDESFGSNHGFFDHLVPFLFNVAKCLPPDDFIFDLSLNCEVNQQSLKRTTILWILAHSLFLNIKPDIGLGAGNMTMDSLVFLSNGVGVERLLCLLSYFHVVSLNTHLLQGSVDFIRYSHFVPLPDYSITSITLDRLPDFIHLQTGMMELNQDHVFVDFANEDIHIHKIITSATQEEILFSTCPELFPSILFCARMTDNDVFLIRGARRFSTYKGYQHSFQFLSPIESPKICNVVAMDASVQFDPNEKDQFTEKGFSRDLKKCYIGFSGCCDVLKNNKIVTGHWGGGVFGGNKILKFLQQLISAALNNCELNYCTFGDKSYDTMNEILFIFSRLHQSTIRDLIKLIISYDPTERSGSNFDNFIVDELNKLRN